MFVLAWLGGALLLVAVLAGLMLRDAVVVARSLFEASDALHEARAAMAVGDVSGADELLAAARVDLADANARTNRLLWRGAERIPLLGRSLTTAHVLVDVADEGAAVGRAVLQRSDAVIDPSGSLKVGLEGRRLTLPPLVAGAEALAEVDRDRLIDALERLRIAPATWVPEEVRAARREALELGNEIVLTLDRAQDLLEVVPAFAGAEEPRRYFLAMQNNAELRGTGGLIGFFSVLTVENGEFTISDPATYDVLTSPDGAGDDLSRADLPPGFEARYSGADSAGFIANVNLDPDLPTVGPVLVDLAERHMGFAFDGVVMIDPMGLSRALSTIGPVTVPAEFADPSGRLPDPVPPGDIPLVTMRDAYEVFGGASDARDDYLRELATAAFELLFDGGWEPIPVAHDIAAAALSRHLQLFSSYPDEQAAFEALGVAGRLAPADGSDFAAVTAANTAANKLDLYMAQSIDVDIAYDGDVRGTSTRLLRLEVAAANLAPADALSDYVAGSSPPDPTGRLAPRVGPHGLNRSWFTVWAPAASSVLRQIDTAGALTRPTGTEIHDTLAVDETVTVMDGETGGFIVDLSTPVDLTHDGPDLVHRFILRRQPRATPDELRITLTAPPTWSIASVTAELTSRPLLPAAVDSLDVAHTDERSVEITGRVDGDVVVEVRFTRSLGTRFDTWMRNLLN